MRYLAPIALALSMSLCGATLGLAQDSGLVPPAKRNFKHNARIKTTYDRSQNRTITYIDHYHWSEPVPYFGLLDDVVLTAGFSYPGKTLTAMPQSVELGLITHSSRGWFFVRDRDFTLIADGKEIFSGTLHLVSQARPRGTDYVEITSITLPTDVFLKLVNSHSVEMKAGPQVPFKLLTEHLEAMRDLASRMTPKP